MRQTHLVIGEITKPQGVRGELKLRPITCDLSRFENLTDAYFQQGDGFEPFEMTVNRITEDAVFLNIKGIDDRNAAEKLRGRLVYVDRAHAVALDEHSTFICDLIGLRGIVDDGRELGVLRDVLQPGGNDVYIFKGPLGEVLVPALKDVVASVNLDAGEIRLVGKRLNEVAVFDED